MQHNDPDSLSDWAASALFSPSKARAQQAQAKDWAAVDAWLARKYGAQHIPTFERNEDTLHALLALASLNDTADEQRAHVERVERTALTSLTKRHAQDADPLVALLGPLLADTHISTLATLALTLDAPNPSAAALASALIQLTTAKFDTQLLLSRAQAQLAALRTQHEKVQTTLASLRDPSLQESSDIAASAAADWPQSVKHLRAKIAEYTERLAHTRQPPDMQAFEDLRAKTVELKGLTGQLEALERQLEGWKVVAARPEEASDVLERAREELRALTSKRDKLFEGMVGEKG